jgi:hypothetical protein
MSLAAFLHRRDFTCVATATPAIGATDDPAADASVANIATIAIAKAATQKTAQAEVDHAACNQCIHGTQFGNCGEPVSASLSTTFRLVAHPRYGKGCKTFKRRPVGAVQALYDLIAVAKRQGAISPVEAEQAQKAVTKQPTDQTYLDEWAQLIRQCHICSHQ